jgi:hypothetical protein
MNYWSCIHLAFEVISELMRLCTKFSTVCDARNFIGMYSTYIHTL